MTVLVIVGKAFGIFLGGCLGLYTACALVWFLHAPLRRAHARADRQLARDRANRAELAALVASCGDWDRAVITELVEQS